MMKFARVDYKQEYIDTLWCEFRIKPDAPGSSFAINPNRLHIWPGGSLMFIAIPSLNGSFTCTLFAPSTYFEAISENPEEKLQKFFHRDFPGVCPELITPSDLQQQFIENSHLPLISIKCKPHHYKSTVVILGDAAHAMVPFYGQGMNAGLEDVRVLFEFLDASGIYSAGKSDATVRRNCLESALSKYSRHRTPDAAVINDLALRNYEEMRSGVQSPLYKMRKWLEETINIYMPRLGWRTQYTRVSFENQRYTEVQEAVKRQGDIIMGVLGVGAASMIGLTILSFARRNQISSLGSLMQHLRR